MRSCLSCGIVYLLFIRVTDEDVQDTMADYGMLPVSVWPPSARKQKKSREAKRLCCCSKHVTSEENEKEAERINMIPNKTHTPAQCEDTAQTQTQTQSEVALE